MVDQKESDLSRREERTGRIAAGDFLAQKSSPRRSKASAEVTLGRLLSDSD